MSKKGLKSIFTLFVIISFFLILTSTSSINAGEENSLSSDSYFVSTNGNDIIGDGSISNPWKTIQKAANMVDPGDTVYIRGGKYYEEVIISNKKGTENKWITLMPYNDEEVIVDGREITPSYYNAIFYIQNSNYIRISGLKLLNSAYGGIHIYNKDASYIWIDNNLIYNCSARGIATFAEGYPLENLIIEYNTVDFVNNNWKGVGGYGGEAISLSKVVDFDVGYNHVSRCGKVCIDVKVGSSYGNIHHNKINTSSIPGRYSEELNHLGIYIEPTAEKSQNISVYNNVVYGDHGGGIWISPEETGGSAENISVYNNIINLTWDSGNAMGCFDNHYNSGLFKHIYFYSNTVYSRGVPFKITGEKDLFTDIQVKNNIFTTSNIGPVLYCPQLRYSDDVITLSNNLFYIYGGDVWCNWYDVVSNVTGFGNNAVKSDPRFLKRSDPYDFHLNILSPAIDKGIATLVPLQDYDGIMRPQGNGFDIGAYEYVYEGEQPIAKIKSPSNISTYQTVKFDASESYDPDGDITIYNWDFGDGGGASGKKTSYIYKNPGKFIVTLAVTDNDGRTTYETITMTVAAGTTEEKLEKQQDTLPPHSYLGALIVTLFTIIIVLVIFIKDKIRRFLK